MTVGKKHQYSKILGKITLKYFILKINDIL